MLSMFGATGRRGPILLVLLMVAALVAACGGASTGAAPAATAGPAAFQPGSDAVGAAGDPGTQFSGEQSSSGSGNGTGSGTGNNLSDTPDLLIIKTGDMVLQVTGIDAALNAATDQIRALGGYASGSNRSGDDEAAQAQITYRIPADKWDQAVAAMRSLATKVLSEKSGTDDVTTQVVDLGARIKNLQATETALQGIMARATEIKDVLAVQGQLTDIRGQIEQATAEKSHLEQQAAYSTLTVTFSLKPDPVAVTTTGFDPKTTVDDATASLVSVLQAVASAGIWFGIVWLPILIVLLVLAFIAIRVLRRFAVPSDGSATPAAPTAPSAESGA